MDHKSHTLKFLEDNKEEVDLGKFDTESII